MLARSSSTRIVLSGSIRLKCMEFYWFDVSLPLGLSNENAAGLNGRMYLQTRCRLVWTVFWELIHSPPQREKRPLVMQYTTFCQQWRILSKISVYQMVAVRIAGVTAETRRPRDCLVEIL